MPDKTEFQPDTSSPIGKYLNAWVGYSNTESIRNKAASGGIITATLDYLISSGKVDAALVCRSEMKEGKLDHEIYLARNREDLLRSQSSKYFDIPMLNGLELIKAFDGRVAVVGLPSQISAIYRRALKQKDLADKIAFRISVFCGHNSKEALVNEVMRKNGISPEDIDRFWFRQGHWRGEMVAKMKNGDERRIPFQSFSHYQNLHILSLERCLNCFDHMGYFADLSCGDTWNPSMKKEPVKHSIFLARSPLAETVMQEMIGQKLITATEVDRKTVYLSQKRSINYHYNLTARSKWASKFGLRVVDRVNDKASWRDQLAGAIILLNHRISKNPRALKWFFRLPRFVVLGYLLVFKGLMNYERKNY